MTLTVSLCHLYLLLKNNSHLFVFIFLNPVSNMLQEISTEKHKNQKTPRIQHFPLLPRKLLGTFCRYCNFFPCINGLIQHKLFCNFLFSLKRTISFHVNKSAPTVSFFLFLNFYLFIFIFGCVGSSFLCEGFLQLRQAGATLHCGAWASHCRGLSCCRAQAPDAQAQQLWLTGLVALRHVGSSQTRARTRVPCISRQILNRCATREAHTVSFLM